MNKKTRTKSNIDRIADQVMKKYETVFIKLAKKTESARQRTE